MILRHCFGLVLVSLAFLASFSNCEFLDRIKRDESYQSDPKTYLDQVIGHWLYKIPILIDESVAQSEKDLTLEVAKKVTQGWSIVIASWKDILSDYVENNRTLGNLGDMTVVYNYGFLFTYGIGFGFPLLLGLPDDTKSCGRGDFQKVLYEYELQEGVTPLLHRGASVSAVQSVLTEFENIVATKLSCIDSSENVQSQIVANAVANLLAAMNARLELENGSSYGHYKTFQARKLDFESNDVEPELKVETESQDLDEKLNFLKKDDQFTKTLVIDAVSPVL